MKRRGFHVHFAAQEKRRFSMAVAATLYAAEPDVVVAMLEIARDLMHTPVPLDREERIMRDVSAGRRLQVLAKRIETVEPGDRRRPEIAAPRRASPRPPRIARPKQQLRVAQLEMLV